MNRWQASLERKTHLIFAACEGSPPQFGGPHVLRLRLSFLIASQALLYWLYRKHRSARPRMLYRSQFRSEYVIIHKRGHTRMLLVSLLDNNRLETPGDRGIGPPVSETRTVGSAGSQRKRKTIRRFSNWRDTARPRYLGWNTSLCLSPRLGCAAREISRRKSSPLAWS
jgi:hypothetical protein